MSLSAGTAWEETAALARREARRIFAIAFLSLSLPAALLQLIAPVTAPGRLPALGPWLLFVPVMVAAGLIGPLVISRFALYPGQGVAVAFRIALRRLLPLLGAAVIVTFLGVILALPLFFLLGGLASAPGADWPMRVWLALLAALWLLVYLFFWVRLLLLTPVAAAEKGGPAALILRSWALTAGSFWRLLGFLTIAALVSLVALMAAGAVGGIAVRLGAAQPQPGMLAMLMVFLVSSLLQALISGLLTVFVARLYAQLTDELPAG